MIPPRSTFARPACGAIGFTLIEILTAISILSFVIVILAQMISMVSRSLHEGQQRVNNFDKARAILNLLTEDLAQGVYRADLPFAASNNVFSSALFYTTRSGIGDGGPGTPRGVSLVQYTNSSSSFALLRGSAPIYWTGTAAITFTNGGSYTIPTSGITLLNTAPGVIGFKLLFAYADGSRSFIYSNNATANPPVAAGVTLAVIDDQTYALLESSPLLKAKLIGLVDALDTVSSGTNSVKADWENYLDSRASAPSHIIWKNYPSTLATGLKIFERYVPLPPQS